MSFLGEIKRRKVLRVTAIYAVVAWLLVQIVATVESPLRLPEWVDTLVIVLLAVGFPIALVLAWAYELTPDGLKREKDVDRPESMTQQTGRKIDFLIIGVLGIAVVYFVAEKVFWADKPSTHTPVSTEQSIAVLPFVNMSPDPDQEYFSDGIAEELLNQLTKIRGLQVAGRTSSFAFKGKNEDLRVIGETLNVAHILEGSVRKAGDRVRITVQLVKAADGFHLWSETFDRDLNDIFAIQQETAKAVASALSIALGVGGGDLSAGGTRNFEAYDAFLAGISLSSQVGPESMARAIEYLEDAVALDPDYAQAWGALSVSYERAANFFIAERTEEHYQKAEAAALRAIAIAPEAVASLRAAARLHTRNRDWMQVEQSFKKALELAPADFWTNMSHGDFLMNVGRPREAIAYFRQAVRTEPLLLLPVTQLAFAYYLNTDFDMALKDHERAEDLIGNQFIQRVGILIVSMAMGDRALIEEALENVLALEGLSANNQLLNRTMASLLDEPEAARAELQRFDADPAFHDLPWVRGGIATWASYFGDPELTLKIHRELFEAGGYPVYVTWEPGAKEMRRLPGFKDLVRELGLVDYWRSTGNWGDFCRPLGHDDFECE